MTKYEKARTNSAKSVRATETATVSEAASKRKFSTSAPQRQGRVESLLHQGAENAVTTEELVQLLGFKSARQLQAAIEAERSHGALILSSSRGRGGYYLPANGEQGLAEIATFERTVRARVLHSLRSLRAARQALEALSGQQKMEE